MAAGNESLLVKNIDVLVTMDEDRRVLENAWMLVRDNTVHSMGEGADPVPEADRTLDARGRIIIPGLINTHHHFYQTLTRAVPGAQNAGLFDWLRTLYPIWARMTAEHIEVSTKLALAELALSQPVSIELERIMTRALCREPVDRYPSVAELRSETAYIDLGSPSARPHLLGGWSVDEEDSEHNWVWSDGSQSELRFDLVERRSFTLEFRAGETTPVDMKLGDLLDHFEVELRDLLLIEDEHKQRRDFAQLLVKIQAMLDRT